MNTKAIKATTESMHHYGRMIRWVETQDGTCKVSQFEMYASIAEDWGGWYCPLCNAFMCDECPIGIHDNADLCNGEINVGRLNSVETWPEWLIEARRIRAYLGMLRGKLKRGEL